ncbi:MAG: L-lactate dehydrogenase [Oscillospiraceae bacterium]|nr:L-lactate dehydrogenase [Oscillospiraceae bacterium]
MQASNFTGKVVVIGAGHVGATVMYSLLLQKLCNEIVVVDIDEDKASGAVLDMQHSTSFFTPIDIRVGKYSDCADADVIVVTAGMGRKPGQTRIDLARTNVSIAKDIAKNIAQYSKDPLVLVISNPVDIITYVMQQELGAPPNRCFGSGTVLDTARLRYACAMQLNIDVRDMKVYMCGEHGDSMFPVWSSAYVGGAPLKDMLEASGANCEEILERTIGTAAEIIRKAGATYYGVANAAARVLSIILKDENAVLPLSKVQEGEFMGVSDVALSLPYVVNKTGIVKAIPVPMSDAEKESFKASAEKLKDVIREVSV